MGYFCIGKITSTHGIKGTLRVFPTTDDSRRFSLLKEVIFELNGKRETFSVEKAAYQKNMVLLTVKEISDINIAEKYRGASILIPDEEAIPLEEDEYYTRDLYDMDVYTSDGKYLGKIYDIYFTAANDVYCVKNGEDTKSEILIPAIKECIADVDIKENKMTVNLLEGMV
ncbi:ribosome maturation factor RimM [Lachnospiraceae bacterium NSJ-143]|nr:ribosome maturation factor RimM [Lachnospiraceae bacterium NSJ-143]